MALTAEPRTRKIEPLPPLQPPAQWIENATGEPLYGWQRDTLRDLTAPDRPRVAYVQIPRKSGNTRFAAVPALAKACLHPRRRQHPST